MPDGQQRPFMLRGRIHGTHAPARQVFMSAVVDLMRRPGRPLSILEIGSDTGASLLTWINAAERLHDRPASILCVDCWGLDRPDENPAENAAFQIFSANADALRPRAAIHYLRGLSADVLPMLRERQFDIVYIDACHFYREALFDITEGQRLVRAGGILCGDDLELQADECDLAFARAHPRTDFIADPRTGTGFHPGVTLAIDEAFGRVACFDGFWATQSVEGRFAPVSLATARGVVPSHWPAAAREEIGAYFAASDEIAELLS